MFTMSIYTLIFATETRDIDTINQILENTEVDVNDFGGSAWNALMIASSNGWKEIVDIFLQNERIDVNAVADDGYGSLSAACIENHFEIVEMLLKHPKINITIATTRGMKPFEHACYSSDVEIIKAFFMYNEAQLDKKEKEFGQFVLTCYEGNWDEILILMKNFSPSIALCVAASCGNLKMVKYIIEKIPSADINYQIPNNSTPFFLACQRNRLDVVRYLLQLPGIDVNTGDEDQSSPFSAACFFGHLDLIKLLITDERIDVNLVDASNSTPFFVACSRGKTQVVEYLLKNDRINFTKLGNDDTSTPLRIAASNGYLDIVKILSSDNRINVNERCEGYTAFCSACINNQIEVVKYLLEDPRVDVNICDLEDLSPFENACLFGCIDLIKLLLNNERIDVNRFLTHFPYENAFLHKCDQWPRTMKLLIESPKMNFLNQNFDGNTFFMVACEKGDLEIAKLVLLNRCDIGFFIQNAQQDTVFDLVQKSESSNKDAILKLLDDYSLNPKNLIIQLQKEFKILGFILYFIFYILYLYFIILFYFSFLFCF